MDLTDLLNAAPPGEWRGLNVRLSCLAQAGADVAAVDRPWGLISTGAATISVETIRLQPNDGQAVCPPAAR